MPLGWLATGVECQGIIIGKGSTPSLSANRRNKVKLIFFVILLLLTSCAMPMEELIKEAHECEEKRIISEIGIVTKPTSKQKSKCWIDVNKKQDSIAKREAKEAREQRQILICPRNTISVCKRHGGFKDIRDCSCMQPPRRY